MITCEEIYDLHTTGALESALCEAYREIPLDSRNSMRKNDTPLHMACAFVDENAVRILLERGADVNVRNDEETHHYVYWPNVSVAGKKPRLPVSPDCWFPKKREFRAPEKIRPP